MPLRSLGSSEGIRCTAGGAAATARGNGSIGDGHLERCEGQVRPFGGALPFFAQKRNCSYLAVKTASAFIYGPTDEWRIPEPGDLFDKDKSMTEQHREEQRFTLEWLQGWAEIKVQGTGNRRGRPVPKRPQIVSTAKRPPCKKDCGRAGTPR